MGLPHISYGKHSGGGSSSVAKEGRQGRSAPGGIFYKSFITFIGSGPSPLSAESYYGNHVKIVSFWGPQAPRPPANLGWKPPFEISVSALGRQILRPPRAAQTLATPLGGGMGGTCPLLPKLRHCPLLDKLWLYLSMTTITTLSLKQGRREGSPRPGAKSNFCAPFTSSGAPL